jgi:hypothetical protein
VSQLRFPCPVHPYFAVTIDEKWLISAEADDHIVGLLPREIAVDVDGQRHGSAVIFIRASANALLDAAVRRRPGHAVMPGVPSCPMMHRPVRAIPALASVLAVGVTVVGVALVGCAAATATAGAGSAHSAASATASAAARASSPFYGPPGPDPACAAALTAEQTLQARQGKDQSSESAIDQDFTNFANALNAAARQATHPATARAMTALADDYTALVASQSGAAQLPSVATMQGDGAAFEKACP